MRVVVDTNVVVSGIFFSGPPFEILRTWRDGLVEFVLSPEILDEYHSVVESLQEEFGWAEGESIITVIAATSEIVQAPGLPFQVCDDPEDDKFLACALAGKSKVIVSGDKHLLRLSSYNALTVMSPAQFVKQYLKKE